MTYITYIHPHCMDGSVPGYLVPIQWINSIPVAVSDNNINSFLRAYFYSQSTSAKVTIFFTTAGPQSIQFKTVVSSQVVTGIGAASGQWQLGKVELHLTNLSANQINTIRITTNQAICYVVGVLVETDP